MCDQSTLMDDGHNAREFYPDETGRRTCARKGAAAHRKALEVDGWHPSLGLLDAIEQTLSVPLRA